MDNYKQLEKTLNHIIKKMNDSRSIFCENSRTDFIRSRKLDFQNTIKILFCMENGSLRDELFKSFDNALDTPTASAFVQARNKIKVDAFKHIFNKFNDRTHEDILYKGYRLLAIDGSELPIDNSIYDKETRVLRTGGTNKPYSAFHINASYDLLERSYDDLIIQGQAVRDENDAFCQLVDRYQGRKAIFIADRGYESYNGFEHVAKSGNKYLVRVKDINSKTSMTRSLGPYPNDEFDIDVFRMLTLKCTSMIKACPQLYKVCPTNMRFDYMSKEDPWYEFNCRIVRFKITEDTYECIITNLDRTEFSSEDIKELYNKRWGIETSFRHVKYAIGLNSHHARKRKYIKQEIYISLTLYNLTQRLIRKIKIEKRNKKYIYQINFTRACHLVRSFLNKKDGKNPSLENLIANEILPIRPGRSHNRNVKRKSFIYFNYRFD